MENHELATLLDTKMGEMLKAMNDSNMTLAIELREDLIRLLVADREKVVASRLTEVKASPKTVTAKIDEALATAENLELNVIHTEAKE